VRVRQCKGQDHYHFASRNGECQAEIGAFHTGDIIAIAFELFAAERKSVAFLKGQNEVNEGLKLNFYHMVR